MVKSASSKDVLWYFWNGFKVVLLFSSFPCWVCLFFHHFNCPKIEHQCLTFNFNLDLDHSTQRCNTSELDFIPLTKHCRSVAYLCKHGPCSVGFDASSLCFGWEFVSVLDRNCLVLLLFNVRKGSLSAYCSNNTLKHIMFSLSMIFEQKAFS